MRHPKDVAIAWSGKTFFGTVDDTRNQLADLIRADRSAVIAEAKRLVDTAFEKNWVVQDLLDALDAILEEKP